MSKKQRTTRQRKQVIKGKGTISGGRDKSKDCSRETMEKWKKLAKKYPPPKEWFDDDSLENLI